MLFQCWKMNCNCKSLISAQFYLLFPIANDRKWKIRFVSRFCSCHTSLSLSLFLSPALVCHAHRLPPPNSSFRLLFIWLASGKLLYQLRLFFYFSFAVFCSRCLAAKFVASLVPSVSPAGVLHPHPASCIPYPASRIPYPASRITQRVLRFCFWLTINHFTERLLVLFFFILRQNWIKIYIFNHLCSMRRCFNLTHSHSHSLSLSLPLSLPSISPSLLPLGVSLF